MSTAATMTSRTPTSRARAVVLGALAVGALAVTAAYASGWVGRHEVTPTPTPTAPAAAVQTVPTDAQVDRLGNAVNWTMYQPAFRDRLERETCSELADSAAAARFVDGADGAVDSRPLLAFIAGLSAVRGCSTP